MENKSIWQEGTPEEQGMYIIAILYKKSGLGITTAQYYHPSKGKWDYDEENEDVIAFIPLQDLLDKSGVGWPEELTPDEYK